jgi:CheY-like chemotaxis protein
VLIVDDFRDGREMIAEYLTHLGFEVETAGTGAEAIEKAAALIPDLVIMDVRLPDADGIEIISQIRRLPVAQPSIVVWTAAVLSDVRERARDANVEMFVPKPCDLLTFAQQIQQLLEPTDAAPSRA